MVLSRADVERLLPMDECVDLMAGALAALARREIRQPLRSVFRPPDSPGLMALMPAHRSGSEPVFGLKAICVFPDNPTRGLDAHQGIVVLADGATGEVRALVDASAITAARTAAVSGVATRLLARRGAGDVAILGAGVQARAHVEAMSAVLAVRRLRLWSRAGDRALALARELSGRFAFPVEAVETAEAALAGADVVCTTTSSSTPVVRREWLSPGAHVNAVGASIPTARELDAPTLAAAALFVDSRESALNESGDVILAMQEGAIGPEHIRAELGEMLVGGAAGRTSSDEITIFESLGLAAEDLAAAAFVEHRARETGAGTEVEL